MKHISRAVIEDTLDFIRKNKRTLLLAIKRREKKAERRPRILYSAFETNRRRH